MSVPTLLVHGQTGPVERLRPLLESKWASPRSVRSVRTCAEIAAGLSWSESPQLVFTETQLPDGTWRDVLRLVVATATPVAVVVVSRFFDAQLYLDVIESGAADFIVPPFSAADIAHISRCAAESIARKNHGEDGAAGARP